MAKVEEAPLVAPHDAQRPGLGLQDGVEVARDQLDQGGFAASVGAEDGDVLALRDGDGDAVQRDALVAADGYVFQFD